MLLLQSLTCDAGWYRVIDCINESHASFSPAAISQFCVLIAAHQQEHVSNMRAYKSMLAAALIALPVAAKADGMMKGAVTEDRVVYSHMTFGAIDVSKDAWQSHSGIIVAFNRDLSKEGFLFRSYGSYGQYEYGPAPTTDGTEWQGDVMLGYQWVRNNVDISLNAGVDVINHKLKPFDTTNPVNGREWGFKVAGDIETRTFALNLPYYFLLDADYSTAFDSYYVLSRLGAHRNNFVFGVEGWLFGDESGDAQRLGAFAMWERNVRPDLLMDVTLSGGYQFSDDSGGSSVGKFAQEGAYARFDLTFFFGDRRRSQPLK
jgi:hypothetical protein